eukprot:6276141-Alexandrium_andersonii.AAC.1
MKVASSVFDCAGCDEIKRALALGSLGGNPLVHIAADAVCWSEYQVAQCESCTIEHRRGRTGNCCRAPPNLSDESATIAIRQGESPNSCATSIGRAAG